ncbi:MAG: DUF885 family protein, partial [Piscinibacter sp.]|nr:DUF885 family protein [Piscinibacter sp.]
MRPLSLLCLAVAFAAAPWCAAAVPAPDAALHALFEREFEVQLDEYPEQATYVGEAGRDARLTDLSPAAVARRKAHAAALLRELQRIDPKRLQHAQSRLSREMMIADLRLEAAVDALYGDLPFEGIGGWQVVGPNGGPHSAMAELAKAVPTRTLRDAEDWLARLDALPLHLEQQTALMRAGLRSGWLPPRAVMSRVAAEFDPFSAGAPEASPLYIPLAAIASDVPAAERERLQAAGRELIRARVQPAYAKMQRFLV